MSDQSGLPPVGELVQITRAAGPSMVGQIGSIGPRGAWIDARSVGRRDGGYDARWIEAWSRVLVVPDTDETRDVVYRELLHILSSLDAEYTADAVLAALREAANPPRRGPDSAANKGQ